MNPSIEYFKRHNINVPLVQHCTSGTIVLKSKIPYNEYRWVIFDCDWILDSHHGVYQFKYRMPNHDAYQRGLFFKKVQPYGNSDWNLGSQQVVGQYWDEYEEYILRWVDRTREIYSPIIDNKDIILSLWEMFVYCYDGWIINQNGYFKDLIFKSVDLEVSQNNRYVAYQDTLKFFTEHFPAILKVWRTEFLPTSSRYANWLAKLF